MAKKLFWVAVDQRWWDAAYASISNDCPRDEVLAFWQLHGARGARISCADGPTMLAMMNTWVERTHEKRMLGVR